MPSEPPPLASATPKVALPTAPAAPAAPAPPTIDVAKVAKEAVAQNAPAGAKPAPLPAWKADGPVRPHHRRKSLILFVLFGLFGLVGVFVGLLYWLSPPTLPAVLPIVITAEPNGNTVPWQEEDRLALSEGAWLGKPRDDWSANPGRDQIRLRFRALASATKSQPVAVYLASPAAVDATGGVFLLPADPLGDHPRNRLPLSELLAAFRDCPARHRLLILNLVPSSEDPLYAAPPGDLSTAIHWTLESTPDSGRLCLVACGPGQQPAASPELGRTAFGWYLEAGLRGDADGWGGGSANGRVTVTELAAFLRDKTASWSSATRGKSQTPELLGSAGDFTFRAVSLDAERSEPADTVFFFPDWLRAAWERHDQWQRDGRADASPWAFRKLRAALLAAERDYRAGKPPALVQRDLDKQVQAAEQLAAALTDVTAPDPVPTLAAVFPAYAPSDPALVSDLREAARRLDSRPPPAPPAAGDKPTPEPLVPPELDAFKAKPHAAIALAAFLILSDDADPSPLRVRGLAQLLALQSPTPKFAETALIARLASLAEKASLAPWSSERAALALRTARLLEESIRPEVFAWAAPAIEHTYRLRANAEAAYFSPGYASTEEATRRLRDAAATAHRLKTATDQFRQASHAWHEAASWLTGATAAIQAGTIPYPTADRLAQAASKLGNVLEPPSTPLDLNTFTEKLTNWEAQTHAVEAAISDFARPFRGEALSQLAKKAETIDAGPAVVAELDALLSTPLLLAADRAGLWNTRAKMARRLADEVLKADVTQREAIRNGLASRPGGDIAAGDRDTAADSAADNAATQRRIQWTTSLWQVGGIDESTIDSLATELTRLRGDRYAFAERLRRVWLEDAPGQLTSLPASRARRLAAMLPVVPAANATLDSPGTNPDSNLLRSGMQAVWTWQAGRFDYESRELSGEDAALPFAIAAARACRAAGAPSSDLHLELSPAAIPTLTLDHPSADLRMNIRAIGGSAKVLVRVATLSPADGWLKPGLPASLTLDPLRQNTADQSVSAGNSPASFPGAAGVLVEAEAGGRSYHHRVPLSLEDITDRFTLLVRTAPGQPPGALRDIRLRPTGTPQPYQLVLANPAPRDRKFVARLAGLGRETDVLTIPAGKAITLAFPAPPASLPPPAPQPLAEPGQKPPADEGLLLKGDALVLQILDPANRDTVRQTIRLPVVVLQPTDYLRVTDPVFKPSNGGRANRLTATIIPGDIPPGGPCMVRMGFPAERNPEGLVVRDGSLTGQATAGGAPLTLYADNLVLPNPGSNDATVTISADGMDRAATYKAALPTRGETLRLSPETAPLIRVKVVPVASGTEPLPVTLEVDNPPPAAKLELLIGTSAGWLAPVAPDLTLNLDTAKEIAARLKFDPKGETLLLAGAIKDHRPVLPLELLVGRRVLEARLLDRTGTVLATHRADVVFDGTPPQDVRFVDIPPRARKDQPLAVRATCDLPISGIKEVKFFIGQPQKNAPPSSPSPIAGKLFDPKTNEWRAVLPVDGQKGVVTVGVQFVSNVGLSTIAVQEVELLDPVDLNKPLPGHIAGKVTEGPLAQPDLVVFLYDDKGNARAKTTTKSDGAFAFKDLVPGPYYLFCVKNVTNRHVKKEVSVKADETLHVALELLLK